MELIRRGEKPAWHWVNNLYLEWFSDANGRGVIQTPEFRLSVSEPLWTMTDEEYRASREASSDAYIKASGIDLGEGTNSKDEDAPDDVFLSEEDGEGEEWKRSDERGD